MKRFLLFSWTVYDERGGWGDFDDSFDTFEEAEKARKKAHNPYAQTQIVDLLTGRVLISQFENLEPEYTPV